MVPELGVVDLPEAGRTGRVLGTATEQTLRAYNEAKTQVPKAIAEANALFTKAAPLAGALATYKLTLTVPAPLK